MPPAPKIDTRRLLTRIAAGETQAFGPIVRHYQKPLFGFLGRMGLPQSQAEEVAQETFLRAWRNLGKFDPARAEFSTWLFTIARNLALNERGRSHGRELPVGDTEAQEPACDQPAAGEMLDASRRREWLQAALARLRPAERTLLALVYTRELSLDAIARIEHCEPGAIRTRLHRARQRLQQLLMEGKDEYRS